MTEETPIERRDRIIRLLLAKVSSYYNERGRHYHTLKHVNEMINYAKMLEEMEKQKRPELEEQDIAFPVALYSAIIFHDIVYIPGFNYNDGASVVRAKHILSYNFVEVFLLEEVDNPFNKEKVEPEYETILKLIECTGIHEPYGCRYTQHNQTKPEYTTSKLLLDLDYMTLGKPYEEYKVDAENIRKEFCHLTDEAWRKGRSDFLLSVLKEDSIYFTEYFQENFEKQARKNILKNLEELMC